MKLTISQPDLASALAPASLCPAAPLLPITAAVLLDADQRLTVRASDYDRWATATAAAEVTEPGRVAVSGRLLAGIAKVIPKTAEVRLETGDTLTVATTTPRGTWTLPVLDYDLFPAVPAVEDKLGTVDAAAFARALGKVLPFASSEKSLDPAGISAVHLHAGEQLVLAATDRYRLAVAELDWQPVAQAELYVPTPAAKAWLELAKASTTLALSTGQEPIGLAALAGESLVSTARLNAEYPQWRSVDKDPGDYPTTAVVDAAEVQRAAAGTLAVADPARKGVRNGVLLTIDAEGLRLTGAGRGSTTQHAPVLSFDGDPVRTGIDPAKLAAALGTLGTPQAVLSLHSTGFRPILFRPAVDGQAQPGYRHLVMPMRTPVVDR